MVLSCQGRDVSGEVIQPAWFSSLLARVPASTTHRKQSWHDSYHAIGSVKCGPCSCRQQKPCCGGGLGAGDCIALAKAHPCSPPCISASDTAPLVPGYLPHHCRWKHLLATAPPPAPGPSRRQKPGWHPNPQPRGPSKDRGPTLIAGGWAPQLPRCSARVASASWRRKRHCRGHRFCRGCWRYEGRSLGDCAGQAWA